VETALIYTGTDNQTRQPRDKTRKTHKITELFKVAVAKNTQKDKNM